MKIPKHVTETKLGKFLVQKRYGGEVVYLGTYSTLKEAKAALREFDLAHPTPAKVIPKESIPTSIFLTKSNKFMVQKAYKKKQFYIGTYKTLEEAKKALREFKLAHEKNTKKRKACKKPNPKTGLRKTRANTFQVQKAFKGKHYSLGTYNTREEAKKVLKDFGSQCNKLIKGEIDMLILPKLKKGPKFKFSCKIGDKKNRLTVIKILPNGRIKCRCDCGNETITPRAAWYTGLTRSCGCLYKERATYDKGTNIGQIKKTSANKNNKLGIRGVSLMPDGKYKAQAMFRRKKYWLGDYDTPEKAAAAYNKFKQAAKDFYAANDVDAFDNYIRKIFMLMLFYLR